MVSQPDDIFSTHITPKGRAAGPTCEAIMEFLETHNLVETLKVVGVDSTAVNTGANTGILKRMEDQIGRKVYWGVCDLYTNELGLRHLFQKIDGPTTGNNSFKGPREQLENHFQRIKVFLGMKILRPSQKALKQLVCQMLLPKTYPQTKSICI